MYGDKILCTYVSSQLYFNIGGIDYVITNENITFPPGEVCVSIEVDILSNFILEETEIFIGVLQTIDTTPDHVSIVKPSTAIGIIIEFPSKYNTCSS